MTIEGVKTIGLIGAGNIGSQVARAAIASGYDVVISNSRGPETLTDLVSELGPQARAGTPEEAAALGDLVVVAIPFRAIDDVPAEPLVGKVVIDTNNYYARRDGNIAALDDDRITSSELLQARLPGAHVVKAFNHIYARQITTDGTPPGTRNRRALAIAGDDPAAKARVAELINGFGFDVVDAGPLAESRRYQPGTPGYVQRMNAEELTAALTTAQRTK
ncbi:MAG TPA: NADPH-dependent F420 reductase [Propionibacteriaceae bacterium]|jgi:predicted dinucleotide-binding enzyme|nr:NADPH-dependent F420 reductase [Propionibacteriaceae bacterium]